MKRNWSAAIATWLAAGTLGWGYESIYPATPVGAIEIKTVPEAIVLHARADLPYFDHFVPAYLALNDYIKAHRMALTVPVEADTDDRSRMRFYPGSGDREKDLKPAEKVTVETMPARTVVSVGLRGDYRQRTYETGLKKLREWLAAHPEWREAGPPTTAYWDTAFVPGFLKRSEVQIPVQPTGEVNMKTAQPASIYDFTMKDIDGKEVRLAEFRGKVVLIVNVASKCGFTPQYEGLEKLYEKYREQGLVILGFPANDFLGQEPGTDADIKSFCSLTYNVTFPMFSKISVKGRDQHPLYAFLTGKDTNPGFAGAITWNFNKFLVGRDGKIVNRFGSKTAPENPELVAAVEAALKE